MILLFTATITVTVKAIAAAATVMATVKAMVVAVTAMDMVATDHQQYRLKVLGKLSGTFLQVHI